MRWRRVLLVVAGVVGLGLLVVVGRPVAPVGRALPLSFANPPLFPGAVAVARTGLNPHDAALFPETFKTVSFRAPAEPGTVLAFYRTTLRQDGWRFADPARRPTGLTAFWADEGDRVPGYRFDVATQALGPGHTVVTLTLDIVFTK